MEKVSGVFPGVVWINQEIENLISKHWIQQMRDGIPTIDSIVCSFSFLIENKITSYTRM